MSVRDRFNFTLRFCFLNLVALAVTACGGAASGDSAGGGYVVGSGRTVPTLAAVAALFSLVVGSLALARPHDQSSAFRGRRGAKIALTGGLISVAVAGVHWANAAGGLGTGNGLAGAIIAVVLGVVAVVLGGLALAKSRRAGSAL